MAGALAPLVRLSLAADAAALKVGALAVDVLNRAYFAATGKARSAGDGDVGVTDPDADDATIPDLCKCEFSLAYGGKILLNTAKLHMKKGKKYGLIGPNGCGKSTLMKAIANGQLEGFPSKAELRTCYVEHDIQAIQESFSVLQYVLSDPMVAESLKPDEPGEVQVIKQLSSLGFTDKMIHGNVTALSGGWKMKCALARALLSNVSLMLLDEPTNHLDLINAAWLTNYIAGLTDVSCMLVSHDTGFLDKVCSHIIHYESFKLRAYKGNLTNFVAKKPEARAYYELSATQFKFNFPEPGFLDGVRSKDKAILKCMKVRGEGGTEGRGRRRRASPRVRPPIPRAQPHPPFFPLPLPSPPLCRRRTRTPAATRRRSRKRRWPFRCRRAWWCTGPTARASPR
jgi:elongation factor 3